MKSILFLVGILQSTAAFSPPSLRSRQYRLSRPFVLTHAQENNLVTATSLQSSPNDVEEKKIDGPLTLATLSSVAFFYWYWLVLGAAASSNGLPVPDFIPMVPGWPPSPEDLQGPLDDAPHFFYLSELLDNPDAPFAPPARLALYNVAEAWIFAYLPALWKDPKRLPRPALLGLWATLGIGLTNAFLAPYLLVTEIFSSDDTTVVTEKNQVFSFLFAGIASAVAGFALFETATVITPQDWSDFFASCKVDRTYFAFVVDICLFSLFQPYILRRANGGENQSTDFIPFVGLMAWLLR